MSDKGPEINPSGSKPLTRLPWSMRNRRLGRYVRAHEMSARLRKRRREERERIRISSRNPDVKAPRELVKGSQSQVQLPNGPFSFTTTVRFAFEGPNEARGNSNTVQEVPAEDGATILEDSRSVRVAKPPLSTVSYASTEGFPKALSGKSKMETFPNELALLALRHRHSSRIWTKLDDQILLNACEKGWKIDRIQRDLLPQRTYGALVKRLQRLRKDSENALERRLPYANSMSSTEGPLKLLLKETSVDPSLSSRPSFSWTKSQDHALIKAYNQGLSVRNIQRKILPQRSVASINCRLHIIRRQPTEASDNPKPFLSRAPIPAAKDFPNSSATDAKAEMALCSSRLRSWTDDETMTAVEARNQGWSYPRIRHELFPERAVQAIKNRCIYFHRRSSKVSKRDKPYCSSYGAVMENEAVDDEEYPNLPKEEDLKEIKKEKLEDDDMAQEKENRMDHPGREQEDSEEANKRSANIVEGNHTAAKDEDPAMFQEEMEDMDTVVADKDIPYLASEDEELSDYVIEDADDDPEDGAAWEDECDSS